MKASPPSLVPILRSDTQGRLLARLFADPTREHNLTELVAWTGASLPTVSREVGRAEEAGVVRSRRSGPTRLVRADERHPLYPPLRQLILATYGAPAVVGEAFAGIDGADAVVLYGSWAARYRGEPGAPPADVDVLVIGTPDPDAVHDAADGAEDRLGVPVQATVRSRSAWLAADEPFLRQVRSRPLVPVLVHDGDAELVDDVAALADRAATGP